MRRGLGLVIAAVRATAPLATGVRPAAAADSLNLFGWSEYIPQGVIDEFTEETGIEVEVVSLVAVFDGLRLGFARLPMYSIAFHCRVLGGELRGHPLETRDVGFFSRDELPWPLAGGARWVDTAFAAINGETRPVDFDAPRTPPWRGEP